MKTQKLGKGLVAITLAASLALTGCPPKDWLTTAIGDLPVVIQIVTSIMGIVATIQGTDPATDPMIKEVTAIGTQAQKDLATVQSLVNDYKAAKTPDTLAKIDAALSAVQKDLQGILTAFHVKNTATQTAVAVGIGLALTTVQAIYSLLPLTTPTPSTAMPTAAEAKPVPRTAPHSPPKPEDLKATYNALVSANFPNAKIQ